MYQGEPNNADQHCAMVWGGHSYTWADYYCGQDSSSGGHSILGLCEHGPGPVSHSVLWLGKLIFSNQQHQLKTTHRGRNQEIDYN